MQAAVVMPNTRSLAYLKDEFIRLAQGKPLILPKMFSMDGLVQDLCGVHILDDLEAKILLFKSFRKIKNSDESLESFFPLGQTLYADFEEIIRNLKPIHLIFKELSQWEETGANFADFLDEEQKELLERFWSHFDGNKLTEMKLRFIQLWRSLPAIFEDFQANIRSKNVLTSGMAYAKASDFDANYDLIKRYTKFYFIGFGHLSETEIRIVSRLDKLGKAKLIWDLKAWYLKNSEHEVSRLFTRLKRKPELQATLDQAFKQDDISLPETNFEVISCLGLSGMAQQIIHLAKNADHETAIIITNPGLIQALVEFGGGDKFPFNITMGYPLAYTRQARWIQKIFNWLERKEFQYSESLAPVLNDGFFELASPFAFSDWKHLQVATTFQSKTSEIQKRLPMAPDWLWESDFKIWTSKFLNWWKEIQTQMQDSEMDLAVWENFLGIFEKLNFIIENIESKELSIKFIQQLYAPLCHRYPVAIKGSYKEGVQVMGLFESRLLDFKNVIVAPAEEGVLPGNSGGQSFLTGNLRRAFQLPDRSQKAEDEIYQFYRLSHRAQNITLLIDQAAEKQPSRIVQQLRYSPGFKFQEMVQKFGHSMPLPKEIVVEKNAFIFDQIKVFQPQKETPSQSYLSPSSLHDLLQCELRFYYKKIEKLQEPENIQNLEMSPLDFGKWVHETIQNLYEQVGKEGNFLEKLDFENMKSGWASEQYKVWNGLKEKISEGDLDHFMIEKEVGKVMAFRFLDHMAHQEKHRWIKNEMDLERGTFEFESQQWTLGGRVDIVLKTETQYWIIDLKTGGFDKPSFYQINPQKPEKIFSKILNSKDLFQMLLYDWLSAKSGFFNGLKVRSQLFFMADPAGKLVDPLSLTESFEDEALILNELEQIIGKALQSFSNPETKIRQTDERKYCVYCAFASICRR